MVPSSSTVMARQLFVGVHVFPQCGKLQTIGNMSEFKVSPLAACRRIQGTSRNPRGSRCHTLGSKRRRVHRRSRLRRCTAACRSPNTYLSFLRSPAPFRSPRRLAGSGLRAPAKAALHVHPDLRKLQLGRFHWFLSFPFQTRAGLLTRARLVLDYQAQHCDSRPELAGECQSFGSSGVSPGMPCFGVMLKCWTK